MAAPDVKLHQWVQVRQFDSWLPMIVTHIWPEEGTISGVALSGVPAGIGWHRGLQDFHHVSRGEDHREWRPLDDPVPTHDDLAVVGAATVKAANVAAKDAAEKAAHRGAEKAADALREDLQGLVDEAVAKAMAAHLREQAEAVQPPKPKAKTSKGK